MARFDQTKLTLRILFENVTSAAGLLIVLGYVLIAIIDAVYPQLIGVVNAYAEVPDYTNPVPQPPSLQHLFGTTYPGIDLYQAVVAAIRVDLWYSFVIVLAGALVGILVGVVAAYYSGFFDEILMRITDIFLSIPYLPFAIAVGFVLGRGLDELSLALVIVWWPLYARYARGQALSIKENAYVEAARASGVGSWGIITKHIVPNVLTPVFVQISLDLGTVVQTFAALTFIGFASANPLLPELGKLISDGFPYAISAPWVVIFPGVTILIFAVAMNLLGDGLRDALDPRNRT
ncbi:MAG TPA: ABC transporter permease [Nitrososphaerales archaeon]|nr:ABC transporter permease [Nitrososphaerales archaeon]